MTQAAPSELLQQRLNELIPWGDVGRVAGLAQMSADRLSTMRTGSIHVNPQLNTLIALASALNVSPAYLISNDVDRFGRPRPLPSFELRERPFVALPLVSYQVAAGSPVIEESEEEDHFAFRRSFLEDAAGGRFRHGRFVVVRVASDSTDPTMSPTIRPGALLVVDRGPHHEGWERFNPEDQGKLFLCRDPGQDEVLVKRVFKSRGRITLWSDNVAYAPVDLRVRSYELPSVLLGRVRWIGQDEL